MGKPGTDGMVQTWAGCPQTPEDNPMDNAAQGSTSVPRDAAPLTLRGQEQPGWPLCHPAATAGTELLEAPEHPSPELLLLSLGIHGEGP